MPILVEVYAVVDRTGIPWHAYPAPGSASRCAERLDQTNPLSAPFAVVVTRGMLGAEPNAAP